MSAARSAEGSHWLERTFAWLAFALPLLAGLSRAEAGSGWGGDETATRAFAVLPAWGNGAVTGWLAPVVALLPVGGRWLRLALLGAFAAGLGGLAIYELARRTLRDNAVTPLLGAALALAATLLATLSPPWQHAASAPGGGAVAVALALGALVVLHPGARPDARRWCGAGLLIAAALAEQKWVGAIAAVAVLAAVGIGSTVPSRRTVVAGVVGGLALTSLVVLGALSRMTAPLAWLDPGPWRWLEPPAWRAVEPGVATVAWLRSVGPVPVAVAAGGLLWGLWRARTRSVVVGLLVLGLADWITLGRAPTSGVEPQLPVRLAALAAVAVLGALGVQTIVLGLQRARLPFARAAAVLLVVLDFAFALVAAESAAFQPPDAEALATDVWTDEALGSLPARAVVLVRTPATVWRFWAAQTVRGERPDVILVPMWAVGRPAVARRLLFGEPDLAGLLRDVAVQGKPGEYSLSTLADARPLFVEVDPSWDRRMFAHLSPGSMWLRFSPHPLGRSDRTAGSRVVQGMFTRALAAVDPAQAAGSPTRAVLTERVREQAAVLFFLGDLEAARLLLDAIGADPTTDPIAAALAARAAGGRPGPIDLARWLPP